MSVHIYDIFQLFLLARLYMSRIYVCVVSDMEEKWERHMYICIYIIYMCVDLCVEHI